MKKEKLRVMAIRKLDKFLNIFKDDIDLPFDNFEFEFSTDGE